MSNLAGLLGPIIANGVEFRFTARYLLNSFFGRFWYAKMERRSKHLNPRAAACNRPGKTLAQHQDKNLRKILHHGKRKICITVGI